MDANDSFTDSFHSCDSLVKVNINPNSSIHYLSTVDQLSYEASDVDDEDLSINTEQVSIRNNPIDKNQSSPPPIFVVDPKFSKLSPKRDEGSIQSSISPLHNSVTYPTAAPSSSLCVNDYSSINLAFIFIEPDANNEAVRDLVVSTIFENLVEFNVGNCINAEFEICSSIEGRERVVDSHFGELAEYATNTTIEQMKIPKKKFHDKFGESLLQVKKENRIHNALRGLTECACSPEIMNKAWHDAQEKGKVLRVKENLFCGNLVMNQRNVYIINGFYMASRSKYLASYSSIHAYCIQWAEETLSWSEFQRKLIGNDDPATAAFGTLRRMIYENYKELGLETRPDKTSNALYVSSSPLRGLVDRCNWLSREIGEDEYGCMLLGKGIPEPVLQSWCDNVIVQVPLTKSLLPMKVQTYVDGMNTYQCTEALLHVYDQELFGNSGHNRKCSSNCTIS